LENSLGKHKKVCYTCAHFSPHDVYHDLGYCGEKGELIVPFEVPCEDFKAVDTKDLCSTIQERGWIYCLSCRKPIYHPDELKDHVGCVSYQDPYTDSVAAEESPTAD